MTVRIYHNSDAGAPVISNAAGSLINVLDAVLVNGYGDKEPLGWTKEYSGTNVAVYRNDPSVVGSTGMYLRVQDTVAGYAAVRTYKTMSDINTGTDQAPSTISASNYQNDIYWHKHYSSTGSPKRWCIMGDERTFYINIQTEGAYPTDGWAFNTLGGAGDFNSFVPGNEWNYMVFGSSTTSSSGNAWPYAGNNNSFTMYIGRACDLIADKNSRAYTICPYSNYPGSADQPTTSPYSGLRFFTQSLICEDRTWSMITGTMRGCYFHIGRGTTNWFENYGKAPGDPSGPDLRQLVRTSNPALTGTILVKESDWD